MINIDNLSETEIRLYMKNKGWSSKDSLSDIGWGKNENGNKNYGYSIWFERWDWHGRKTMYLIGDKVCFHRHTNNLKEIYDVIKGCAVQALKAYEDYKDCIPYQNSYDKTDKLNIPYNWNNKKAIIKDYREY